MKINRNMSAVMTNKSLLRTENRLQESMKRLSSGFKLNSAKDNPAGMAISNKMKAQIDGLDQAKQNVQNGISVLQIADGALQEVTNILQRMRELSVQAAGDINCYEDKVAIQKEIDQLKEAVNQIADSTEYNTKKLLDGSSDVRVYAEGTSRMKISDQVLPGKYTLTVNANGTQATSTIKLPQEDPSTGKIVPNTGIISVNGISMELDPEMTQQDCLNKLREVANEAGVTLDIEQSGEEMSVEIKSIRFGASIQANIEMTPELVSDLVYAVDQADYKENEDGLMVKENAGTNAYIQTQTAGANQVGFTKNAVWYADGRHVTIKDNNGFSMDFLLDEDYDMSKPLEIEVTDIGDMTIQIGANEFQSTGVRIQEVSTEALYLDTVDVSVVGGADEAISTIDKAIAQLMGTRTQIGAFQNRMDYAESSLSVTNESMTAAYSRILDADMAYEMTEYAQINVLDQATISVLSQANDIPQQILSLLS